MRLHEALGAHAVRIEEYSRKFWEVRQENGEEIYRVGCLLPSQGNPAAIASAIDEAVRRHLPQAAQLPKEEATKFLASSGVRFTDVLDARVS
jgi:hypothetical protein